MPLIRPTTIVSDGNWNNLTCSHYNNGHPDFTNSAILVHVYLDIAYNYLFYHHHNTININSIEQFFQFD